MRDCMNQVRDLIRARTKCIWIQTFEEADVIEDIKEMLLSTPKFANIGLNVWSMTEGLTKIPVDEYIEPEPPIQGTAGEFLILKKVYLQALDNLTGSSNLWIIRDLHATIAQPKNMRFIRDVTEYERKEKYNPFIVISPTAEIPEDIAHLFRIVEYSLPDEGLLNANIVSMNKSLEAQNEKHPEVGYMPLTKDEIHTLTKACVGMTDYEQRMALRESIAKFKTLDLGYMSHNKIEMVKKTGVLDYKIPQVKLEDIGGNEAIKDWINESIDAFSDDAANFGIDKPKGMMLMGIPGTGKTVIAEAMANKMHVPLLVLSMSKIMDKMVGQSEKKIDHALRVAKACAPAVLLMDEVEKDLGAAGAGGSSNQSDSGITNRVFAAILKFMNDNNSGVYVAMTSNDVSQLPPEFTRAGRLDAMWYFGLPSDDERRSIFQIHFSKKGRKISDTILDAAVEASQEFTGAEIEQAVKNSLRKAFTRIKKTNATSNDIIIDDVIAGCHDVIPVAKSSREKIAALENWCKGRAKSTSYSAPAPKKKVEQDDDDFDFSIDL